MKRRFQEFRTFLREHAHHSHKKLFQLRADPLPIALGFAIGVFYGFTPFFGFKTVLALATAWPLRANLIAAALGVAAHDIALPFVPGLLWIEYEIGAFLLGHGGHASGLRLQHMDFRAVISWQGLREWGWPMTVGSLVIGLPAAGAAFFLVHRALRRYRENGAPPGGGTGGATPMLPAGKTEAPPVNCDPEPPASSLRARAR